jgi:hypothetical protein
MQRKLTIVNEIGQTYDGYHNFDELYDHRCHLMVALMLAYSKLAWRADKNEDGSKWPGWFTAGINLPTGQITFHLPERMWSMLDGKNIQTHEVSPAWKGHSVSDIANRLLKWITLQ